MYLCTPTSYSYTHFFRLRSNEASFMICFNHNQTLASHLPAFGAMHYLPQHSPTFLWYSGLTIDSCKQKMAPFQNSQLICFPFHLFRCSCKKCRNSEVPEENACCQEKIPIVHTMEEYMAEQGQEIACITDHPGFRTHCLDVWSLQMAYSNYHKKDVPGAVNR